MRLSSSTLLSALLVLAVGTTALAQQTTTSAAPAKGSSTTAAAAEIAKSASPELVGLLTKELGVTPKQAEGGAGAIFGYAKTAMKPADYAKVEKAVPGIDGLQKAAPAPEPKEQSGTLGALTGAASQLGGTAGAVATLAPAFQKLGLSGDTVTKFVPVVVGFVSKKGGTSTGDLLGAVLK